MGMRRPTSFLTSQSMGTRYIAILVVHDDPINQNIIFEMLENCSNYEVMNFQNIGDALYTMREKKDRLHIVLTDVQQSNSNGFEILKYIEKELKLQIISMKPHEKAKVMPVGLSSSAKLYFLKSVSGNEFKTLWDHAYMKVKANTISSQKASIIHEKENMSLERESWIQEEIQSDQNHKRNARENTDEQSREDKNESVKEKKQRFVWNEQMHHKFLTAIEHLGHEKPYPKKIAEIMKVPGLTRENVASHLQKYRLQLKRTQEEMQSTGSTSNLSPGCFKSSCSNFNSSNINYLPYQIQSSIYTPYQPKLSPPYIPIAISNFLCSETSTTAPLNFGQLSSINNSIASETAKTTSSINYSCLILETDNNTNPINIPLPLTNLPCPNLSDISTRASNLVHQESILSPYTLNSSPLLYENPQPDSSNNNTYVGFKLSGNGISCESGKNSVQINNDNMTNNPNSSDKGQGNRNLHKFRPLKTDNNGEQQFYVPQAVCEVEDLLELDEVKGAGASPPITSA